ncbi:TPM domain-containing protein [Granulicella tundricola]|uniref:TPM domain-containing protein n=1 Tax=Granulicella tundricola (strain ATCC BAA-1859 / DSM 23138 / MP5ACTX9) TaxID=1198114 RepID=E8WXJ2_GRATM|nr:TPM domain-containing protein [Granulicella tundricola]ADW68608.1 protein of unknown function DUF477 [Granulicella tundricola MP5ACTX9]
MTLRLPRFLVLLLLLLPAAGVVRAEKVADLPLPTSYVNDFAGVLSPGTKQNLEDLCVQLHQKANADVAVVTIKTLEDDEDVDDFAAKLEEKWKLGKKGEDRSLIYLLVLNPHKMKVEVGYGLEGILPDARVGRILDTAVPSATAGDYDQALLTGTQGLADVIAADAHVTLTGTVHHYRREGSGQRQRGGFGQLIVVGLFVLVLIILVSTGNIGWAWMLLSMFTGGGGGGGGRDDDRGGGFGGMGGGSSGGGGASRDF